MRGSACQSFICSQEHGHTGVHFADRERDEHDEVERSGSRGFAVACSVVRLDQSIDSKRIRAFTHLSIAVSTLHNDHNTMTEIS